MAVFYNIDTLPAFRNAVITVGTFDGVHLGHRVILKELTDIARAVGGESILVTFDPHPRKVLFPQQSLGIITPLRQKLALIKQAGIDHVIVVPFTPAFAALSAIDYIQDFLVGRMHPHTIVIGYDHRFGNDRRGGIEMLEEYAAPYGYKLAELAPALIDAAAISSTRIRKALEAGDVQAAAQMLGRNYAFSGIVQHGRQLGRTIGYPTANLQALDPDQVVPGLGIYAIRATNNSHAYGGMMSIGYNPTVTDTRDIKIEANLFDFGGDIYGQELEVELLARIRSEEKFASLDELKARLALDKAASLAILAQSGPTLS